MCKQVLFWVTEYLNYFSLIFWGIKLFLKKYDVHTAKKGWIENVIIIVVSAPVVAVCTINNCLVIYSNFVSHLLALYIFLFIMVYTRFKLCRVLALVAVYVYELRLIDLLIVTIISEVNYMSRDVNLDLIHLGIERSIFLAILSLGYYFIYSILSRSLMLEYFRANIFYQWILCIYSFFGILCFGRVYRFEYTERLIRDWTFYIVLAFIICGIFIFYFVRVKSEESNRLLKMRNDLLESNYQALYKAYDENRMLSHDFKNHVLVINQLVQEKRNEEALEYIKIYVNRSLSINHRVESGCKIIDIILNCKIAEAAEKNIKFTYEIEWVGNLAIQDIDMCALLANLLDNAIEACEKIEDESRWIHLKIRRKSEMLLILLENSIVESKKDKESFFVTTKKNKIYHGLGLKSIENVVQKYEGYKECIIYKEKVQIYISLPVE